MENIFLLIVLILLTINITRLIKLSGLIENIITSFLIITSIIILWGLILSSIHLLGNNLAWLSISVLTYVFCIVILKTILKVNISDLYPIGIKFPRRYFKNIKVWYKDEVSYFEKLLITLLAFSIFTIGILNLVVIIFTAPGNWDSMTYHLARMAHYINNNSLEFFNSSYWAQVTHPKNSTILVLFTYLVSGKNENLTQICQYFAYWISILTIFGIARKIGLDRVKSIFSSFVFGLLINVLMESTTTQNDLIMTALIGSSVYFLFSFKQKKENKFLILFSISLGILAGIKETFLMASVPIGIILIWVLTQSSKSLKEILNKIFLVSGLTVLSLCIFSLPSGYFDNLIRFGNPIGNVERHLFIKESAKGIFVNGMKNSIRFGFNFLMLDGLPNTPQLQRIQEGILFIPKKIVEMSGLKIENPNGTLDSFSYSLIFHSHEDYSYWGIFGFSLIWIIVLLSIISVIKSNEIKVLSIAAIVFVLMQAYAGPYDIYRGRYFTECAIFAVPAIGWYLKNRNNLIKSYILLITIIGCISAFSSIFIRESSAFITINNRFINTRSILTLNRIEQLSRNRPWYIDAISKYEAIVPLTATVATYLPEDDYEYPLFGKNLTRTIKPIHLYTQVDLPIPEDADYLLYSNDIFPCAEDSDLDLGNQWSLRKLGSDKILCSIDAIK